MTEPNRRRSDAPGAAATAGSASLASLLVAVFGHTDAAKSYQPPLNGSADLAPVCPAPEPQGPPADPECSPEHQAPVEGATDAPASAKEPQESEAQVPVTPTPPAAPVPEPTQDDRDGGVKTQAAPKGEDKPKDEDRPGRDEEQDDRGNGGRNSNPDKPKPDVDSTAGESGPAAASFAFSGPRVAVTSQSPIPSFLLPIYQECGRRYGIPWRILAAINQVESAFGSNLNVSSAGALGWMQFMPATWRAYGVDADGDGRRDPYDPDDAICAAASYLRASGAHDDLRGAIYAYNHADWYVEMVLSVARSYAGLQAIDPLPRAKRLDREFARELARISRSEHADWAWVLAVLRAGGARGRTPASAAELRDVATAVAHAKRAGSGGVVARVRTALGRRSEPGPGVKALARYNRAVGLRGLVYGLNAARQSLADRVLDNRTLAIYDAGRRDVQDGRVDPRILTLLLYLAESHEEIVVTSLISGHGYYARPGVPSAHAFGEAIDIATIDGTPLLGNQQPGGVAERALREILSLPHELQPAQLISLFKLGGPSFAAADHHDHIHVGY